MGLCKRTIQDDFVVSGPFKLFKDQLIHTGTCLHQGCSDDRYGAAVLNVSRKPEKTAWKLQCTGLHATRKGSSCTRTFLVKYPPHTCKTVYQNNNIPAAFKVGTDMCKCHFDQLYMIFHALITTAGENLRRHGAAEIGDFLRPFINQQNNDPGPGITRMDGLCHMFQERGLPCLGWGDNQAPCSFTNRCHKINNPHACFTRGGQVKPFARVYCGKRFVWPSVMKGHRRKFGD